MEKQKIVWNICKYVREMRQTTYENANGSGKAKESWFENWDTLRKKCPYSKFFWSVFSCIGSE